MEKAGFCLNNQPDVNKMFIIGNKQYLCKKIEAEIKPNENGSPPQRGLLFL